MSLIGVIAGASRRRGATFTPTSIADIALWLDGADETTMFDATSGGSLVGVGEKIARWEDKSGADRHATQATSDNRPTRQAGVQNSLDIVRFGDALWLSGPLPAFASMTVFTVMRQTTQTFFPRVFTRRMGSNNDFTVDADRWIPLICGANSSDFGSFADNALRAQVGGTLNVWHMFRNIHTGTQLRNSRDGGSEATYSHTLTVGSAGDYFLSKSPTQDSGYFRGDVAENIVYLRTLTAGEISQVESYLQAKWDL